MPSFSIVVCISSVCNYQPLYLCHYSVCPNLMQNVPNSFLCDMNISSQLSRGNAFLVAGDKVHCKKPFHQRNLGILKDSTYGNGEIRLAMAAMKSAIGTAHTVMLPAERTYNIVLVPSWFKDCPAASFLGIKIIGEFVDAIEVTEVYHKSHV